MLHVCNFFLLVVQAVRRWDANHPQNTRNYSRHLERSKYMYVTSYVDFKSLTVSPAGGTTAEAPYRDTPLDFISHNDWFMNVLWKYYVEILNKIHLRIFWRHDASRPINRLPSDSWPVMSLGLKVCTSFLVHSYSAIFVLGWNFYFPSRTEQILWRVSSIFTLMYGALGTVCGGYCMYFLQPPGDRRLPLTPKITILQTVGCWNKRVTKFTRRLRNNSPDHDPTLTIPLRMLVPSSILCLLYVFSRAYILLEDAIGLRKLPSRAFETVNWPQFMPHL